MKSLDWPILVLTLILCGFGAAIIGSVAPEVLLPQILFYLVGLGLFFVISNLDFRIYASFGKLIYIAAIVLLSITLFIGLETRGAVRWIPLGPFRLQFSEILKPFLIVSFASFLSSGKSYFKSLIWIAIPLGLIFKQPDLGSALVYAIAFGAMILSSGINLIYPLLCAVGAALAAPLGWNFLAQYQRQRILTFLNPGADPLGASYNSIQSLITVGSGMFFGKGLGQGTQSHLSFLPERHTDFVFASLAEEMGFVGATILLGAFFLLLWRIFKIAGSCKDKTARLAVLGIGAMLLAQIFVNVGMNLAILPVTGITLPLVSYGGSSVLATMISLGMVAGLAKDRGYAVES
ncbi:MAG: rod shape-determining protein RodA [Patescibacteria group bacterium]|nr:rod shape-determining protein RodA [Patescibacteria group bacterium]MCL5431742.1 rod shape-determining protein RodA [Patescibacteria group bacterium]